VSFLLGKDTYWKASFPPGWIQQKEGAVSTLLHGKGKERKRMIIFCLAGKGQKKERLSNLLDEKDREKIRLSTFVVGKDRKKLRLNWEGQKKERLSAVWKGKDRRRKGWQLSWMERAKEGTSEGCQRGKLEKKERVTAVWAGKVHEEN
jgi:hypothetical protein